MFAGGNCQTKRGGFCIRDDAVLRLPRASRGLRKPGGCANVARFTAPSRRLRRCGVRIRLVVQEVDHPQLMRSRHRHDQDAGLERRSVS